MYAEIALRTVLLGGLLVHKALWELLKQNGRKRRPSSLAALLKIAFLIGLLLQTLAPVILPIAEEPFTLRVIGLIIYFLGLLTAILARVQLGANWSDIERGTLQPGHNLVDGSIYGYIRHPIYTGDLLLILGLELALNSWLVLGLVVITPVVVDRAVKEERILRRSLTGYAAYCDRTWRFLPWIV